MKIEIYQVDAFAGEIFKGNPAAVCPLNSWLDSSLMQKIAKENNLSETVFFVKKGSKFEIKWFTPEIEIDLCGHATLAAAYIIFEILKYKEKIIEFDSNSGILKVIKKEDIFYLDFPSREPQKCEIPDGIEEGLGGNYQEILKSRDYFVIYDKEEDIKKINPDYYKLSKIDTTGIIITAKSEEYDFVSRYFAPNAGIFEDPVTGSAHCSLIPYWSKILGKNVMRAYQLSDRGGELFCENIGERVLIGGKAKLFMKGEIYIGEETDTGGWNKLLIILAKGIGMSVLFYGIISFFLQFLFNTAVNDLIYFAYYIVVGSALVLINILSIIALNFPKVKKILKITGLLANFASVLLYFYNVLIFVKKFIH